MIGPVQFFKCLSDETRLGLTLLIQREGELCVCELMEAMQQSQPKISRHLAQLRNCGILDDTRRGQWVFYAMHPDLPEWALEILNQSGPAYGKTLEQYLKQLHRMADRPACC